MSMLGYAGDIAEFIVPATDVDECDAAIADDNILAASLACPATDFLYWLTVGRFDQEDEE